MKFKISVVTFKNRQIAKSSLATLRILQVSPLPHSTVEIIQHLNPYSYNITRSFVVQSLDILVQYKSKMYMQIFKCADFE